MKRHTLPVDMKVALKRGLLFSEVMKKENITMYILFFNLKDREHRGLKGNASHLLGVKFSDEEGGDNYNPNKARQVTVRIKDNLGQDYTNIVKKNSLNFIKKSSESSMFRI